MRKTISIPRFIGAKVTRREDPALLTGKGRYVADIPLEGAATMAFVRSPYAHAKVLSVDAGPALALPGVLAAFTYDDLRPQWKKPLPVIEEGDNGSFEERFIPERYPLASDRVRHVGDPVAVIVAEDPYLAADAAGAVVVEYEPLEVVSTPEAALAEGASRIHEGARTNRGFIWSLDGGDV